MLWTQPYLIGNLRVPMHVLNRMESEGMNMVVLKLAQTMGVGHIREWLKVNPKRDLYDFFCAFAASLDDGIPLVDMVYEETDKGTPKTVPWKDPFEVAQTMEYDQFNPDKVDKSQRNRTNNVPGRGRLEFSGRDG